MRQLAAVQAVDRSFIDGSCKLAVKGRRLVFQGRLNKVCRNGWKSRQFFLFNDLLAYGTPLTASRYTTMRSLPLAGMEVSLADDSYAEFGFQITTAQKSFLVLAADDADRNMWLAEVRCAGEAPVCAEAGAHSGRARALGHGRARRRSLPSWASRRRSRTRPRRAWRRCWCSRTRWTAAWFAATSSACSPPSTTACTPRDRAGANALSWPAQSQQPAARGRCGRLQVLRHRDLRQLCVAKGHAAGAAEQDGAWWSLQGAVRTASGSPSIAVFVGLTTAQPQRVCRSCFTRITAERQSQHH